MTLNDPVAFGHLYDEHGRGVYGAALRILGDPALAQDVTQDVFLKLWRNPTRFDETRGPIGPYLRLMARSRSLDLWRERQAAGRANERAAGELSFAAEPADRPDDLAVRDDERAHVRAALHVLPAAQREALVLAYWGGLTADEVARRVGVPLGTAKSRIRLGLTRLRAEIESEGAASLAA
jgi:RNA polymerase sigma-70 factor (ECF subfamily)